MQLAFKRIGLDIYRPLHEHEIATKQSNGTRGQQPAHDTDKHRVEARTPERPRALARIRGPDFWGIHHAPRDVLSLPALIRRQFIMTAASYRDCSRPVKRSEPKFVLRHNESANKARAAATECVVRKHHTLH